MPIYKGNQKIGTLYVGGGGVNQVYHGSQLVYSSRTFPIDQIIVNSSTGDDSGSFTLKSKQKFQVEMYGGGAGGSSSQRDSKWFYGPGAGGAGFAGIVELQPGTYSWKVGARGYGWNINNQLNMSGSVAGGDSSLINTTTNETYILAGGAPANHEVWSTSGGTFTTSGGTITTKDTVIISFTKKSNGNSSAANNTPGASLYDGTLTGYGAGNNSFINGGTRYAVGGFVYIKAL